MKSRPQALTDASGRPLHWERGYRCHGLWAEPNVRLGVVGIGPRAVWAKADGYSWQVDSPRQKGTAKTLAAAKLEVERRVCPNLEHD